MTRLAIALAALLTISACRLGRPSRRPEPRSPTGSCSSAATEALKERKWLNAREYFRQVVDNYPQSPLRPDAKLGVGDSYLGEDTAESLVLAANEFREFLSSTRTSPRADYAQYKLAMSHFEQMRAPERDQTETREALKEFESSSSAIRTAR